MTAVRRPRRATAAAVGGMVTAAVAVAFVVPPQAGADPATAVGWWTRSATASAPAGGFVVGAGVDGATSVAALTVDVASGAEQAVVELTEAGGLNAGAAAVDACVLAGAWEPEAGGDWATAPATVCATGATPVLTDGDGTWQLDVLAVAGEGAGTVSVLLVPRPSSDAVASPWEVSYEPPEVTVVGGSSPPPPTAPVEREVEVRAPEAAPAPSTPAPTFEVGDDDAYAGTFTAPPSAAAPTTTVAVAATDEVAAPAGAPPGPVTAPALTATTVADDGRSLADALRLVVLSLAAGAVAVAGRKGGRRLAPALVELQARRTQRARGA